MTHNGSTDPNRSVALIFPGQGSQFPGMGKDLVRENSTARHVLEQADDILGYRLSRIMFDDDPTELNRTVHTQPAVFVYSIAILKILQESGPLLPCIAAGHSLGEYSALVAAQALSFEDALQILSVRASSMNLAQPPGTCGMAALIGPNREKVIQIISACRGDDVLEAANFNAPDQTVISGHTDALERTASAAEKEKRTRCVMLPVSSAFHTSLMEPAQAPLRERLATAVLGQTEFPVTANVNALPHPGGEEGKQVLVDQIVKPVLWSDSVNSMKAGGANCFVEIGPGKVLTGLLRRIDRKAEGISVNDLESALSWRGVDQ